MSEKRKGRAQPPDSADREAGAASVAGSDLRRVLGWRQWAMILPAAVVSGLLLSASFSPVEWSLAAWFALVPLLVVPAPARLRERMVVGFVLGYTHFVTSLHWLNEVGFGAGYLLAVYCALYPMVWYVLTVQCAAVLAEGQGRERPWRVGMPQGPREALWVLAGTTLWVGLEWLRSWLFTGFAWNAVGISQWRHIPLLSLTTVTGVAGISFLVVTVNLGLASAARRWWLTLAPRRTPRKLSWGLGTAAAVAALAGALMLTAPRVSGPPVGNLRVLAVQGNIPQYRFWTEAQFQEALGVYTELTRLTEPVVDADLVVWPESAVPAPLDYEPFSNALEKLFADIDTPVLIGALVSLPLPDAQWTDKGWDPPALDFNSAVLFAEDGTIADRYDKIHLVPFGEYVPFRRYLPWLVDLIGMGRDLTAGREFTLMPLANGARAGVNICFEDVFPAISRQFVKRGANVLMTLTNDAWYVESSGSRQHMIHSVFRAAENRRPLLRSGNNSDTCLILPDGRVTGLLYDREGAEDRFIRATRVYSVPVYEDLPVTLYARLGDWFASLNGVCALAIGVWLAWGGFQRREHLYALVTDKARS